MAEYTIIIDLVRNVVNGKRVLPQVAELTYALAEAGGSLPTNDLIAKMYGLAEPQDALTRLRGVAYEARKSGIPIWGEDGCGGLWRLTAAMAPPTKTHCKQGHALTPDNVYQWTGAKGRVHRYCMKCRRRSNVFRSALTRGMDSYEGALA